MADQKVTHSPLPWSLELCRVVPEAPIFGFAIKAPGRIPFVASAGVSGPHHAFIVAPEYRNLITTGFTEAEAEANAELIVRAVNSHADLLAALKEYQKANRIHHDDEARLFDLGEAAIAKAEAHHG